jgi:hypothetical protein
MLFHHYLRSTVQAASGWRNVTGGRGCLSPLARRLTRCEQTRSETRAVGVGEGSEAARAWLAGDYTDESSSPCRLNSLSHALAATARPPFASYRDPQRIRVYESSATSPALAEKKKREAHPPFLCAAWPASLGGRRHVSDIGCGLCSRVSAGMQQLLKIKPAW